jgi:hypothetical protein
LQNFKPGVAAKGLPMMNGTEGRLTTLEILIIFILALFFFMGCTTRQPTLDQAPASLSPGQATPSQQPRPIII